MGGWIKCPSSPHTEMQRIACRDTRERRNGGGQVREGGRLKPPQPRLTDGLMSSRLQHFKCLTILWKFKHAETI